MAGTNRSSKSPGEALVELAGNISTRMEGVEVDGQAEAFKLLRELERLNWSRNSPRKSAQALHRALTAARSWPAQEQKHFYRVISDWLVSAVLGCVEDLDSHERALRVRKAKADPEFQGFLTSIASNETPH